MKDRNPVFHHFCFSVIEAMQAVTHGYGSSPMHSDLYHLEEIKERLHSAFASIPSPTDFDCANYVGALDHVDLAIKLHKDDDSPCCWDLESLHNAHVKLYKEKIIR